MAETLKEKFLTGEPITQSRIPNRTKPVLLLVAPIPVGALCKRAYGMEETHATHLQNLSHRMWTDGRDYR